MWAGDVEEFGRKAPSGSAKASRRGQLRADRVPRVLVTNLKSELRGATIHERRERAEAATLEYVGLFSPRPSVLLFFSDRGPSEYDTAEAPERREVDRHAAFAEERGSPHHHGSAWSRAVRVSTGTGGAGFNEAGKLAEENPTASD